MQTTELYEKVLNVLIAKNEFQVYNYSGSQNKYEIYDSL